MGGTFLPPNRLSLAIPGRQVSRFVSRFLTSQRSGDDRARTGNLRLAKPALSQLSYVPRGRSCRLGGDRTGGDAVRKAPRLPSRLQWAHVDSNHGPQLYQSCALTN